MLATFGTAAIGFGVMLIGAVVLAIPLARLIAEPSGSLFYPRIYAEPHPPYGIPESKVAKGQYEEAMQVYEQIAAAYGDQLKAYVGMIDVAIMHLNDPARALAIYERGMAALVTQEKRDALTRMYRAIRSRLQPEPQWLTEEKQRKIGENGTCKQT
jgi:hypothetical protein